MKKNKPRSKIQNENGLAMIETLPLLFIFVVLLSFGLGFFGFVHTAIMNSIGARAYAFETFQHRADVSLFRDYRGGAGYLQHVSQGNRFHTIDSDKNLAQNLGNDIHATTRNLAFGRTLASSQSKQADHNVNIYTIEGRNRKGGVEASPAWVMVGYGLCINSGCGD